MLTATELQITLDLVNQARDLSLKVKCLEAELKAIKDDLAAGYFYDNDTFIFQNRILATRKEIIRIDIDKKLFEAENPELAKKYERITSYKQFSFK